MPSIAYRIYRNGKYVTTVYSWYESKHWRGEKGITIEEERL